MSIEGAIDEAAFETYVEDFLAPTLKKCHVVVRASGPLTLFRRLEHAPSARRSLRSWPLQYRVPGDAVDLESIGFLFGEAPRQVELSGPGRGVSRGVLADRHSVLPDHEDDATAHSHHENCQCRDRQPITSPPPTCRAAPIT